MGSMGDLIKGSLKKFGTMDLTADSDASLNRSDHFVLVMIMPTSKLTEDGDGLCEQVRFVKDRTERGMPFGCDYRSAQGRGLPR